MFTFRTLRKSILGAVLVLAASTSAQAEDVGSVQQCLFAAEAYEVVWQKGNLGQILQFDMSASSLALKDSQFRAKGWRLRTVQSRAYACGDGPETLRFDALWMYEPDVEEQRVFVWDKDSFVEKNTALRAQGWRLYLVDAFQTRAGVRYTATWRKSSAAQVDIYGWSYDDFVAKAQEKNAAGWGFWYIDTYLESDNTIRYNASWRKTGADAALYKYGPNGFETKYDSMREQGFNLIDDSIVWSGAQRRHNAVFQKTNKDEVRQTYLSMEELGDAADIMQANGWNIVFFESQQYGQ